MNLSSDVIVHGKNTIVKDINVEDDLLLSISILGGLLDSGYSACSLRRELLDDMVLLGLDPAKRRTALRAFDTELLRCRSGQVTKDELQNMKTLTIVFKPVVELAHIESQLIVGEYVVAQPMNPTLSQTVAKRLLAKHEDKVRAEPSLERVQVINYLQTHIAAAV